ncbi:SDR family oxidoreductase [Chamaesiphon sp. OTE_75_metabat_556]|uniref:SDR family oxidoreductase n=1 Tax=Chamaesiphon sp. OTE_75_metabat_556 TaxID=2964692 RepID=UPI00286B1C34|nr:SDR family oxidoreductase [Chamaesiphon sp. OTE_75_metabat_556]
MYDSADRNSPFDENVPAMDMSLLQQLIGQHAQRHPLFENITILGCGYVGTALAEYWQEQGHLVTGTTTSPDRVALLSKTVSTAVVMKGNDLRVSSVLEDRNTLVVSVAPTGFQAADEASYAETYLATARNIANALSDADNIKQVIYLSSCSVYGDRQGAWVDETARIDSLDRKSQLIYEAEQTILQAATDRQKVCVLRLGGIYGPGRELVSMFGGLAGMTMPGKGDRFINWIHRDDIVGAIEFARLNELNGIYNLVDDSQLTIKEQVERVCTHYHLPAVDWDATKLSLQRKSLQVSNQKLKTAGYNLIHPQILV